MAKNSGYTDQAGDPRPANPRTSSGDGGTGSHADQDLEYSGQNLPAGAMYQGGNSQYGGRQFDDFDKAGARTYGNSASNNVGTGNTSGRHFNDFNDLAADNSNVLSQCNVIEYDKSAAFNMAERITVSVDEANRGMNRKCPTLITHTEIKTGNVPHGAIPQDCAG
jgi:hypothetical protein